MFSAPQVNIYSEDVVRSVEFYRRIGFEETFRTPPEGPPIHVELGLDGFTVGIAAVARPWQTTVWTSTSASPVAAWRSRCGPRTRMRP